MRFSAFFASHISRISGSSSTRRTVGQLWGPSAPGTHNPQGSPGRNGHIGVAALLLTRNKATPGAPRDQWSPGRGVSFPAHVAGQRHQVLEQMGSASSTWSVSVPPPFGDALRRVRDRRVR